MAADGLHNNYRDKATLLRNNLRRNNWVQLQLQGTRSNRDAIGARVVLHTEHGPQTRTVRGGSGFLSDEPATLNFGLKNAMHIERLEIVRPSRTRQIVTDLPINQLHRIIESPPREEARGVSERPPPGGRIPGLRNWVTASISRDPNWKLTNRV